MKVRNKGVLIPHPPPSPNGEGADPINYEISSVSESLSHKS